MKKTTLLISILSLILISSCTKDLLKKATIKTHSISSKYTGKEYEIKVLLPKNYGNGINYPTVYLIDGYYHFNDVGNEKIRLVKKNKMQDVILVSIEYLNLSLSSLANLSAIERYRTEDLTYPEDSENESAEKGGGALLFYDFMKHELIPLIDQSYSTNVNNRTLLGHSLGGYFALFQAFNSPSQQLFDYVVSVSPTLFWAETELMKMTESIHDNSHSVPVNLFLSMGSLEAVEMNAYYDEFVTRLTNHPIQNLNVTSNKFKKDHFANAKFSFSDALKTIY